MRIDPEFLPLAEVSPVLHNPHNIPNMYLFGSGTYYGDASGGELTSHSELRRFGCAFIALNADNELQYAVDFNLPGQVQTVARGDAYALSYLVSRLKPLSIVTFVTDNMGVYNIMSDGPRACIRSMKCDIFESIFRSTIDKAIKLTVRWMPSHRKDEDERPEGASLQDVLGNRLADLYAGNAAVRCALPVHISAPYLY